MVDLGGYVIVLVERHGKIKLFGSPAERSDCDEILEINGKCLENASHQQIINYVHECIRTRTICLRVKRRTVGKLAIESSLVDAFVIGSKGREHLQQIARDSKITPRDIAQLSRILSIDSASTQGEEGQNEPSSSGASAAHISLPGASSSSASTTIAIVQRHDFGEGASSATTSGTGQPSHPSSEQLRGTTSVEGTSSAAGAFAPQTRDALASGGSSAQASSGASSRLDASKVNREGSSELPIHQSLCTRRSAERPALPSHPQASHSKQTDQRPRRSDSAEGHIEYYELSDENGMELVELSRTNLSGAGRTAEHRELPVDVPDSFIGVVKQQPRYPPPAPAAQPRSSVAGHVPDGEKLRKYSDDVTKKKAEDELMRSSLRGSKKLQQLEGKRPTRQEGGELQSAVNDAFEPDDELDARVPEHNKVLPLPDLELVIERLAQQLDGEVKDILVHSKISKLISIYKSVMQQKQQQHSMPTVTVPSGDLVQEIITLLQEESSLNSEAAELLEILTRFELEGLCYAFDQIVVSERDLLPSTSSAFDASADAKNEAEVLDENLDPSVRVVRIEKSSCEPLGATVRNEPDGSVIIGRIVKGGAAEKSGLLHEGDEVLEVNGIEMKGRNVNQVCDILAEMTGTLTFVIAIRDTIKSHASLLAQVVHLKALYDYDPDDDLYIPCRELGICFTKGDVLHVIDQQDANWWQAYREGEHDQSLAGLIPSANFQMQREAMKQSILSDTSNTAAMNYKNRNHKKSSASSILLNCGKRSHHRRKKRKSQVFAGNDEILTYEEVSLYYPRANIKRPIVLIGPTNIGRHELRQRLMQDTERFAAAVPHTSRTRRDGEIDAIDYHFISRQQFEQDIKDGRFVEHGEYEKSYYGTSLSAIEAVVQSGKICVLNLHVHSIPILRQGHAGAKLKPYFVFVAPPTQMDKLNRLISSTAAQNDGNNVSHAELTAIIEEARDIESRYGHFFDMVLSITDIDRAYQELLREINALEREPQWIPNIWMK